MPSFAPFAPFAPIPSVIPCLRFPEREGGIATGGRRLQRGHRPRAASAAFGSSGGLRRSVALSSSVLFELERAARIGTRGALFGFVVQSLLEPTEQLGGEQ